MTFVPRLRSLACGHGGGTTDYPATYRPVKAKTYFERGGSASRDPRAHATRPAPVTALHAEAWSENARRAADSAALLTPSSASQTWQWHPVAVQSSSELDLRRGLFLSCCRFLLAKYEPTGLLAFVEHHRRRWRLTV